MIAELVLASALWFAPNSGQEFLGDDDLSDQWWEVTDAMKNNSMTIREEWKKLAEGGWSKERALVADPTETSWTVQHRTQEQLAGEEKKKD